MREPLFTGQFPAAGEKPLFAALLALALFFSWLAMSPCLDNGFINWDETRYITRNPKIQTLTAGSVAKLFSEPDLGMYAPLAALSYALDYRAAGLTPKRYHTTNLLLHLANTALVMFLARLLLAGVYAPFAVALLFGIHPAHVESVAWAAERKDVLYAFFYLASFCCYLLRPGRAWAYPLSLLLFLGALLSKSMAVTLPLVLLLADYLKEGELRPLHLKNKAPYLILAALFAAIQLAPGGGPPAWYWPGRVITPLYNLGFYLYTLLWPFNLSAMYVTAPGGKAGLYALAAATAVLALPLVWFFRKNREIIFGAGFFAAALLPVLQFLPFGPVISADRYTYVSSVGIFLLLAAAGRRAWAAAGPRRRAALGACAVLAVFTLTAASRARCAAWENGITLWRDTLQKQPAAAAALVNLCGAYLQYGLKPEARACLRRAIETYPEDKSSYYNLGFLEAGQGDLPAAERLFLQTLEREPCHAPALNNLGNIRLIKGRPAEAGDYYRRALACDKDYSPARQNLERLPPGRRP
ncbi:MAG: tetratricopeptide repeat protein [Elusimicrobiales bacterium]|nr:tetratricopeptide repeat protein [Elusimicrobiales bacterium]